MTFIAVLDIALDALIKPARIDRDRIAAGGKVNSDETGNRHGQYHATGIVNMLPDQINPARHTDRDCRVSAEHITEGHLLPVHSASRNCCAACSGITSTVKTAVDCSTEARYLSLSFALSMQKN